VDCWSPVHYALLGVSLCTAVPFLVIIPWFLHRIIVQHTVFNQPPLHEKHVRSREIEYMIGVSDLYEQDRTFVFASYRRYFVYSPVRDGSIFAAHNSSDQTLMRVQLDRMDCLMECSILTTSCLPSHSIPVSYLLTRW